MSAAFFLPKLSSSFLVLKTMFDSKNKDLELDFYRPRLPSTSSILSVHLRSAGLDKCLETGNTQSPHQGLQSDMNVQNLCHFTPLFAILRDFARWEDYAAIYVLNSAVAIP
ncbi:hypothetical protein CC2G_011351 [Coprinopsis cinerea AmutBmut pab1-1]|nr:hypothetical protein CC2G_011351 [Coprinopsis cinerea AmutBmut pab1-1]